MAEDIGIFAVEPGQGINNPPANSVVMQTSKPMFKIDTQNSVAFQTILLIITTNPPEPAIGSASYTTLYSFNHGYSYVPSIESLFYVSTPPAAPYNNSTQTYFQDKGLVGGQNVSDQATLYAIADKTKVYIVCQKTNGDGGGTLLTGTNVQITLHIFVDDIGV